jgi:NAD(P) transhydrogenase subunit alpha
MIPPSVGVLTAAGVEVLVQKDAGDSAGYADELYVSKGAVIVSRDELFLRADVIVQVHGPGDNPDSGDADIALLRAGQTVIAMHDPLGNPEAVAALAKQGVSAFSLELVPRISRAQSMDVLSSMATIAGYQAVIEAAAHLTRLFPMLMTAAGTLAPARVFVVGVGVAGLQALATAKRLGAAVEAYDVRPAVREQVLSVGAKFVEFDLETDNAEGAGGYAKEQSEEFIRRQAEQMKAVVARSDVLITTAAIPGKKAPVLVTADMVAAMAPGSVVVDLAAARGGNCELSDAGLGLVHAHGVTILCPADMTSRKPYHASQMFSKNVETFLTSMITEGELVVDREDEIVAGTLLCADGEVVNPRIRELLGIATVSQEEGSA